ncbi:MAG: hypothetical protein V4722_11510 [Bacteroidota bacterium]
MKPVFIQIVAAVLLLFNGIGACYGGYHLMMHPDGSSLEMSLKYLDDTPFGSYFIPGIVLFICNGLCSFFVLLAMLLKFKSAAILTVFQGAILIGWIIIQVILIGTLNHLHMILASAGAGLVICGLLLLKSESKAYW